jgi:hypothetical protein
MVKSSTGNVSVDFKTSSSKTFSTFIFNLAFFEGCSIKELELNSSIVSNKHDPKSSTVSMVAPSVLRSSTVSILDESTSIVWILGMTFFGSFALLATLVSCVEVRVLGLLSTTLDILMSLAFSLRV